MPPSRPRPNTHERVEEAVKKSQSVSAHICFVNGCPHVRVNVTNRAYGADKKDRLFGFRGVDGDVPEWWRPCVDRLCALWDSTVDKAAATFALMDESVRIDVFSRGTAFDSAEAMQRFPGTIYVFAADEESDTLDACAMVLAALQTRSKFHFDVALRAVYEVNRTEPAADREYARQYGVVTDERAVIRGVPHGVMLPQGCWQPRLRKDRSEIRPEIMEKLNAKRRGFTV